MKKVFIILLFLTSLFSKAQQGKISFDYDAAGNQILRLWCPNCSSKTSIETPKEVEDITSEDLTKFHPEDIISYYPNPVKEQLYLKWDIMNDIKVVSIDLYSLNGQLFKSVKNLQNTSSYNFPFQELPQGIYSLNLMFSNGETKPIKIIKK